MTDRSRRDKMSKVDKLAEYRRAREGGSRSWKVSLTDASRSTIVKSLITSFLRQVEDDVNLYDEVTEDQYKSIVRGRLQRDDFVVDDGVTGYMDNGMDDFGEADGNVESDDDVDDRKKNCASL
jgi:DNA polymerase alpha subunit A